MTKHSFDLERGFRDARERSGLTLRQIADTTKISVRSLSALENNRIDQLPGGIYRRAIVRSFAAAVGLDSERTLRQFLEQYPDDVPSMAQLLPPKPSRPRAWQVLFSVLGGIIPVVAGVFYFTSIDSSADRPRHIADLMPERTAPAATILPAAPASSADSVPMMISVSATTRLQIVVGGQQVLGRDVTAGEVVRLDLTDEVVLVGDDAGAVHFSINGRAGRTFGDSGTPLTARIVRDDYHAWLIDPQ